MCMSLTEQLMYSTIRIESFYENGGGSTGTGYFLRFKENKETGKHIPVIITNKHVIEGSKKGRLTFITRDENGNPSDTNHISIELDNFEYLWKKHPSPNVDLCVLPIGPIIREHNIFYISLDTKLIPTEEQLEDLSAFEDILMIGYPNGIWDYINNKPIFRKGVTATHPKFDYNGTKEFMIDMACFPGSSGSPVFLLNEGMYSDKKGGAVVGNRIYLLGTLYAGPQHTARGDIEIVNVQNIQKPISISKIPNNLGLVIKSSRILELENLF